MNLTKKGSSFKQQAYARRLFGGQGQSKTEMALNSGYSPHVARSVVSHIENSPGFHNAMAQLAYESNNLAMAAMHEFEARGFSDFSNKEMVSALTAIANAWSKFTSPVKDAAKKDSTNKLRTVILKQLEVQEAVLPKKKEDKIDLDF